MPIPDKQSMTAVARIDTGSIQLITITQHDSMKTASKEYCGGNGGTVCRAYVKHLVAIVVYKSASDVATPSRAICPEKERRFQ